MSHTNLHEVQVPELEPDVDDDEILTEESNLDTPDPNTNIEDLFYNTFSQKYFEIFNNILDSDQKNICLQNITNKILIDACPGSGKTFLAVLRLLKAVDTFHCKLNKICFLCLTNGGVTSINKCLIGLYGKDVLNFCSIFTFHSFALKHINEYNVKNNKLPFEVLLPEEKRIIIKKLRKKCHFVMGYNKDQIRDIIDYVNYQLCFKMKNKQFIENIDPDYYKIYEEYNHLLSKKQKNKIDYLSILLKFHNLLKKNQITFYLYYIFDEAQDIGYITKAIITLLITPMNLSFFAVMDSDQDIFSFSKKYEGKRFDVIKYFVNGLGATKFILENNYRVEKESKQLLNATKQFSKKLSVKKDNVSVMDDNTVFVISTDGYIEQLDAVIKLINKLGDNNSTILISSRIRSTVKSVVKYFNSKNIKTCIVKGKNIILENDFKGVYVSNFHQCKGLEFTYVIVLNCVNFEIPYHYQTAIKKVKFYQSENDILTGERNAFYVVISRGKRKLFLFNPGRNMNKAPSFNRRSFKVHIAKSDFIDEIAPYYVGISDIDDPNPHLKRIKDIGEEELTITIK